MNMQQWKQEYLASSVKKPLPILSFPGIQLIGKTVEQVVSDAQTQAECMQAIAQRYPEMAVALGPMDLSVEAEAFGSPVSFSANEVPTVTQPILDLDDPSTADELKIPAVGAGRTGVYVKAMELASASITDRPVFSGCIGPFSLAGRLMDMADVMLACMDEPEMMETILEKTTEFLVLYITALKAAGAKGVVMAEPAAGLLSPALNEEFSVPYVKKIAQAVKAEDFLFCYHNCGPYVPRQLPDLLTIEADLYHFGDAINMDDVKDHIPSHVLLSGNISPVECFKTGDETMMKEAVSRLLNQCGSLDNFVPSSGCDIPPDASLANADVFFNAVQEFYYGR